MFETSLVDKGLDTDRIAYLVADRIWPGKGHDFGPCRGIAVLKDGALAAGLIYHNYHPDEGVVEISGAAWIKGWLTRPVLRRMYGYPFEEVGCGVVVQRVSDDDTAQHRMLKAYGAERHRIPHLRGLGKADNIFVLTRDAWAVNRFNAGEKAAIAV